MKNGASIAPIISSVQTNMQNDLASPQAGRLENIEVFNRENYALFRAYLEAHRDEFRTIDLGLAAFVCVTSIEALTHTAVLHHSDSFSDEAFEALVDEATRLVVRYLQ